MAKRVRIKSENVLLAVILLSAAPIAYFMINHEDSKNQNKADTKVSEQTAAVSSVQEDPNICKLPDVNTNWYVYMDLDRISDPESLQYQYKTDYSLNSDGLWQRDNDYVVAMGSGYAAIGDRFEIETDTGNKYTVFVGDQMSDYDTDPKHEYYPVTYSETEYGAVIEFIVSPEKLAESYRISGNLKDLKYIGGKIVSLKRIP